MSHKDIRCSLNNLHYAALGLLKFDPGQNSGLSLVDTKIQTLNFLNEIFDAKIASKASNKANLAKFRDHMKNSDNTDLIALYAHAIFLNFSHNLPLKKVFSN